MAETKGTYRGFTEAQARANKRYLDKFVDVKLRLTPEERETIKAHAQAAGESVSGYIKKAVSDRMERER